MDTSNLTKPGRLEDCLPEFANEQPKPQGYPASVSVLVLNDKRQVLLVKRADTGDWCAPGGKLEYGEHLYEGARRELREECNALVGNFVHAFFTTGNNWNGAPFVVLYLASWLRTGCKVRNMEPEKHTEMQWFDIKDVPGNTWDRQAVVGFIDTCGMVR